MASKFSSEYTIITDPDYFEGEYVISREVLYVLEEETKNIIRRYSLSGCTPEELTCSARRKAHLDNDVEIFYDEDESFEEYKGRLLTSSEIDDAQDDEDDDDWDDDDDYNWDDDHYDFDD